MESTKKNNSSLVVQSLKGALISVIVSLIGILFFAFFIKIMGISEGAIKPINQIIKAISIFIGVFLGVRISADKGLLRGLLIGIIYTFLAFIIFSALNGKFSFDKTLLNDVLFGGISGAICGIICVNLKKKTK